jgi:hypothetical protein
MGYKGIKEHSRQPSLVKACRSEVAFQVRRWKRISWDRYLQANDGSPIQSNNPQKVMVDVLAGLYNECGVE